MSVERAVYPYGQLTWLAVPAILNNAAAPVAVLVDLALLTGSAADHVAGTERIAAYALVSGTLGFAVNVFNFLISVTMSQVGFAVGKRRWKDVGRHVRTALMVAIVVGALCTGLVYALKPKIFELFGASASLVTAATPYFHYRLASVPLLFVCRVCSGVIGGYQRVWTVASLNLLTWSVDILGNYVALYVLAAGLAGSGLATLIALGVGALVFTLGMVSCPPTDAMGSIRWSPSCCRQPDATALDDGEDRAFDDGEDRGGSILLRYLRSSGNMMVRSLLLQGCMFSLYILASRLGTSTLAAHHIIFQLWSLTSYICDGFADVGTMLGSKMLGEGQPGRLNSLANRLLLMGLGVGTLTFLLLIGARDQIQGVLTRDPGVIAKLNDNWWLLAAMQPVNASVFVYDGVLYAYGQRGFAYIRNLMLIGCLGIFVPAVAVGYVQYHSLLSLWVGKNILTLWRCLSAMVYVDVWRRLEARNQGRGDDCSPEKAHLLGSVQGQV